MKLRRDVRDWVVKAEEDYLAAQALRHKRRPALNNAVCFHSQQCAEKYLKAFLTYGRIPFPKTHDLIELLDLAKRAEVTLELLRSDLECLQPYSVGLRYPGNFATRREALRSVRVASHIRNVIRQLLRLT